LTRKRSKPRLLELKDPPGETDDLLRALQMVLLKHPLAAQAAFSALIAEGRKFGETPEGRQWRARLSRSKLAQRGRVVWEVATLNMLRESPGEEEGPLPSALVDGFLRAASDPELEPMLSKVFESMDGS
jgi:hypothetical protein